VWNRSETDPAPGNQRGVRAPIVQERRLTGWIGKGVTITGDVVAVDDLNIDGHVEGRITARDHHVTIGSDAEIKADLIAKSVTICGAIAGNVTATDKVHISDTGAVQGNITTPRFTMIDGAVLSGSVKQPRESSATVGALGERCVAVMDGVAGRGAGCTDRGGTARD
jgi:cytoskeletal protein CcmA (bactofilin family)